MWAPRPSKILLLVYCKLILTNGLQCCQTTFKRVLVKFVTTPLGTGSFLDKTCLAHGKEATFALRCCTAKPLPCNVGESHGKETFAVNGIAVRPLSCGVARQNLCRAYSILCRANSCTAKSFFPVVSSYAIDTASPKTQVTHKMLDHKVGCADPSRTHARKFGREKARTLIFGGKILLDIPNFGCQDRGIFILPV
jgi:hypothetical protein